MANPVEVDDALVLLLGAPSRRSPSGRIEGITRLEKLLFLLEKEGDASSWMSENPGFIAYNYGPFTPKVYQAVDSLASAGILQDSASQAPDDSDTWEEREAIGTMASIGQASDSSNPYVTRDFELTERGWRYYSALAEEVGTEVVKKISTIKEDFAALPLNKLVRYVYTNYDDYTTKSVIRDRVLGHGRAE
jgi:uncharacterized protein YwgA